MKVWAAEDFSAIDSAGAADAAEAGAADDTAEAGAAEDAAGEGADDWPAHPASVSIIESAKIRESVLILDISLFLLIIFGYLQDTDQHL